jgi:hypothetical protein
MLSMYGGIWLDASILLNKPLDWIHAYQVAEKSEYVGYKINLFSQYIVKYSIVTLFLLNI